MPAKTLSKREAAAEYLALVKPFNVAAGDLRAEVRTSLPEVGPPTVYGFVQLRKASKKVADANRVFTATLLSKSQRWPKEPAATARKLAAEAAADQSLYRSLANAETPTEWQRTWNEQPAGRSSAELLRLQLGLPEKS